MNVSTDINMRVESLGDFAVARTFRNLNDGALFPTARQLSIVVLSQVSVIFFRWNRFNPPSVGWFEVLAQQMSTRYPYNNYEIKFPPLGIFLEGRLPLLLSEFFGTNVYLVERYWHVVAWVMLSLAVYLLSTTYCGVKYSLVPACLGLTIYQLQPYKIISGYLELALTFWAFGTYLLIVSTRHRGAGVYKGLFVTGSIFLYSSWLVKQSFIFSIFCSLLAVIVQRDGYRLLRLKMISSSLVAFLFLVAVWAKYVGGSSGFWYTMFDGSSKGVTPMQIPVRIIQWGILLPMANQTAMSLLLVGLIILGVYALENQKISMEVGLQTQIIYRILYTTLLGLFFVSMFSAVQYKYFTSVLVLVVGVVLLSMIRNVTQSFQSDDTQSKLNASSSLSHYIILVGAFWVQSYVFYVHGDWSSGLLPAGVLITNSMTSASIIFVLFCILDYSGLLSSDLKVRRLWRAVRSTKTDEIQLPLISAVLLCVAIPVMNSLSGGTTFESWMFSFILMATFFVFIGSKFFSRLGHEVLLVLTVLLIIPSGFALPYTWWGLDTGPIALESEVRDPKVSGLKIHEADAGLFQVLDGVIEEYGQSFISSGRKPLVFMGPQIAGLKFRYDIESVSTTCAIVWFDVCSAKSASKTFEEVKSAKPDLIVWLVEPEVVLLGHEDGFLEGKRSEVRKFQSWLMHDACAVGYKKISIGSNPWYHENMHIVVFVNQGIPAQCV